MKLKPAVVEMEAQKSSQDDKGQISQKFYTLYNKFYLASFVLDFLFIIVVSGNILSLGTEVFDQFEEFDPANFLLKSGYVSNRIFQALYLLLMNHIAGTFPFFYNNLTIQSFPTPQEKAILKPLNYYLQIAECVLMFLCLHLKFIARLILNDQRQDESSNQLVTELKLAGEKIKQAIVVIIVDILSVVAQSLIFQLGFDLQNNVNRLILYIGVPLSFGTLFLVNYFLSKMFSKQLILKSIFKVDFKLTWSYIKQFIFFFVFGLILAGCIDLIMFSYGLLRKWISTIESKTALPAFNQANAKALGFSGFSFVINMMSDYLTFLKSSQLLLAQLKFERKRRLAAEYQSKNRVIGGVMAVADQILLKEVKQKTFIFSEFIKYRGNYLITQFVLFVYLINSYISDFVTLAMFLASGQLFSSSAKTLQIVSMVVAFVLMALYLGLITLQVKFKSRLLGFLTYVCGFFAIPSIVSVDIIRNFVNSLVPCDFSSVMDYILTNLLVPFTALISFLQSLPLFFPNQLIHKHADLQSKIMGDEIKFFQENLDILRTENSEVDQRQVEAQKLQDYTQLLIKQYPEMDYKMIYRATKYSLAVFEDMEPRKIHYVIKSTFVTRFLGIVMEKRDKTLIIAFKGTRSALDLSGFSMIFGYLDWILNMFAPTIAYKVGSSLSYVNWYLKFRAVKALKYLSLVEQLDQYEKVLITGQHSGACSGTILCDLMINQYPNMKIQFVGFNMPHLVGAPICLAVQQKIEFYKVIQIGFDGKVYFSSIFNNQLSWSSAICVGLKYGNQQDEIKSNFFVVSAGGNMCDALEAVRSKLDCTESGETEKLETRTFNEFMGETLKLNSIKSFIARSNKVQDPNEVNADVQLEPSAVAELYKTVTCLKNSKKFNQVSTFAHVETAKLNEQWINETNSARFSIQGKDVSGTLKSEQSISQDLKRAAPPLRGECSTFDSFEGVVSSHDCKSVPFVDLKEFIEVQNLHQQQLDICEGCGLQLIKNEINPRLELDTEGEEIELYQKQHRFCYYSGRFLCETCANQYYLSLLPSYISGVRMPISGASLTSFSASYYEQLNLSDNIKDDQLKELVRLKKLVASCVSQKASDRCLNQTAILADGISMAEINDWFEVVENFANYNCCRQFDSFRKTNSAHKNDTKTMLDCQNTDLAAFVTVALFEAPKNKFEAGLFRLCCGFLEHLEACKSCQDEVFCCAVCRKRFDFELKIHEVGKLFTNLEFEVLPNGFNLKCRGCGLE